MIIRSNKSYTDGIYAYELITDEGTTHYGLFDIKEKKIIGYCPQQYQAAVLQHFINQ